MFALGDAKSKAFKNTGILSGGSDMKQFKKFDDVKQNILSEKTTGVHKVRGYKLPRGTRTVYFEGGWRK